MLIKTMFICYVMVVRNSFRFIKFQDAALRLSVQLARMIYTTSTRNIAILTFITALYENVSQVNNASVRNQYNLTVQDFVHSIVLDFSLVNEKNALNYGNS